MKKNKAVTRLLLAGIFAAGGIMCAQGHAEEMNKKALAKYEPEKGCYIGAVLDWADLATKGTGKDSPERFAAGMSAHNETFGKKHALFEQFIFFPHGAEWEASNVYNSFPTWSTDPAGWATAKEFCAATDAAGATAVLTIEPYLPRDFYTDWKPGNKAYDATVVFAQGCAEYGKPVFIRFAHEMNGSWYPWCAWLDKNRDLYRGKDEDTGVTPALYVQMYRNFVTLFRSVAPNAAFIWCPNQGWLGLEVWDPYTEYYPGDDVVDWVGLDFYERGWYLPMPAGRLWGGQFKHGLVNDSKDNPQTKENESVNFYKTYCEEKGKPLMICETGATMTYRTDLPPQDRASLDAKWKAGWWDKVNYGWLLGVFGTSRYADKDFSFKIDELYPKLKGIIWFHQAKAEDLPAMKKSANDKMLVWYNKCWCDYRIDYNSVDERTKYSPESVNSDGAALYKKLIENDYYLSGPV